MNTDNIIKIKRKNGSSSNSSLDGEANEGALSSSIIIDTGKSLKKTCKAMAVSFTDKKKSIGGFLVNKKTSFGHARVVFQKSFSNLGELASRTFLADSLIKKNKFESLNNIEKLAIEDGDMSTSSSSSSLDDYSDTVSPKPDTSLQQNVLSYKHRSIPSFSEILNKSLSYLTTERFFSSSDIINVVQDQSMTINNGTRNFVQTLTKSGPVMKTLAFINSTGIIKSNDYQVEINQTLISSKEEDNEFETKSSELLYYIISNILQCQQSNQAYLYFDEENKNGNRMEVALMNTAQVHNNLSLNKIKNLINEHIKRFKNTNDELVRFMELCSKYNQSIKTHEIMYKSIEQEKSALETEMNDLKDQILLLKNHNNQNCHNNFVHTQFLNSEVEFYKHNLSLNENLENLVKTLTERNEEIMKLKMRLETNERSKQVLIEQNEEEFQANEKKVSALNFLCENQKKHAEVLQSKVTDLEAEIQNKNFELAENRKELQNAKLEIIEQVNNFTELKDQFDSQALELVNIQLAYQKLKDKFEKIKTKKKCPVENCNGMGNTINKRTRHNSVKFCPMASKDNRENELNNEIQIKYLEINNLKDQLNEKNANLAELQGDLKKRDDDLASLQSIKNLQQKKDKEAIEKLKETIDVREDEIQNLKKQIADMQSAANSELESNQNDLRIDIQRKTLEINYLKDQIDEKVANLADIKDDLKKRDADLACLQSLKDNQKKDEEKIKLLKETLSLRDKEIQNLKKQISEIQSGAIAELESKSSELTNEINNLKGQINEKNMELTSFQLDHEQLKLKAQNQENKIIELSNKNQSSAKFINYSYENTTPIEYSILENSYATNSQKKIEKPKTKKCPVKNCDGKGNTTSRAGKWHTSINHCPNVKKEDLAKNTNTFELNLAASSITSNNESNIDPIKKNEFLKKELDAEKNKLRLLHITSNKLYESYQKSLLELNKLKTTHLSEQNRSSLEHLDQTLHERDQEILILKNKIKSLDHDASLIQDSKKEFKAKLNELEEQIINKDLEIAHLKIDLKNNEIKKLEIEKQLSQEIDLKNKNKEEIELLKIKYSNDMKLLQEENQKKQNLINNVHDQNVEKLLEKAALERQQLIENMGKKIDDANQEIRSLKTQIIRLDESKEQLIKDHNILVNNILKEKDILQEKFNNLEKNTKDSLSIKKRKSDESAADECLGLQTQRSNDKFLKLTSRPIIGVYNSKGSRDGSYVYEGVRGGQYYMNGSEPSYLSGFRRLSVSYFSTMETDN